MVKITSFSLLPQTTRAGTFCRTSFLLQASDTPNEVETYALVICSQILHQCTTTYLLIYQGELRDRMNYLCLPVEFYENFSGYMNHRIRWEESPEQAVMPNLAPGFSSWRKERILPGTSALHVGWGRSIFLAQQQRQHLLNTTEETAQVKNTSPCFLTCLKIFALLHR